MSLYRKLRFNPVKVDIKKDAREIQFFVVSCMCDNKYKLTLKKKDGEFRLYGNGYALSNYSFKGDVKTDCEWQADDQKWDKVVDFINSGTVAIEKVMSR